jgi:hypothetical protein
MPAPHIDPQLPTQIAPAERLLTAAEYRRLAEVPPEAEWFANITNPNSKRAYEAAVGDFIRLAGVENPKESSTRTITRVLLGSQFIVRSPAITVKAPFPNDCRWRIPRPFRCS